MRDDCLCSVSDGVSVKLAHEHYLDKWLTLYEFDDYKRWLFSGVIKILKKYVKQGSVLEIGCSKGYLTELVNREGYFCVGGDISITALKCAKNRSRIFRFDGELLPFKDGFFDAVLAINTLEHMPMPCKAMEEAFRVLKAGGLFLAITPDKDSLVGKLGCWLVKYTSLKNPYHVGLMNKREMSESLGRAGFRDFAVLSFHNGFLGAPFVARVSRREFIPIPIDTYFLLPFSHHQMAIALKHK